jgi:hypothetical protein
MNNKIWTRSIVEELIAVLWLIAGLLAWQSNIKWFAWILFVKAALDTLCAIHFAICEAQAERTNTNRP